MAGGIAVSILAFTVSLSLVRPHWGRLRIHHSTAAVLGAALTVASGLVSPDAAFSAMLILVLPIITIVSLMVTTLVAERAGVFDLFAGWAIRLADGDGRRLFSCLFFAAAFTGMVFTNDAAVLIFTPLAIRIVESVGADWTARQKLPFFFAVLYVANLVGAFVISNPINIVACSLFGIGFWEFAGWMALPALVSLVVNYVGLRIAFRNWLPQRFDPMAASIRMPSDPTFLALCVFVLATTVLGFLTGPFIAAPTWLVALVGAVALLILRAARHPSEVGQIVAGVGWDVIIFVVGIFIVALGLRNAGLTQAIASLLHGIAGESPPILAATAAFVSALLSSIMNNHPTVDMMAWVVRDLELPPADTNHIVYGVLIGGDLGPKMLPIGSLAALLWFRILRDRSMPVRYWQYIRIGVPVTLGAVLLSVLTLNFQHWLLGK